MPRELPTTLSVNDAAALMLNISYLPGANDLLEMLSFFREEAQSKHDHAKSRDERDKYTALIVMSSRPSMKKAENIMNQGLSPKRQQ